MQPIPAYPPSASYHPNGYQPQGYVPNQPYPGTYWNGSGSLGAHPGYGPPVQPIGPWNPQGGYSSGYQNPGPQVNGSMNRPGLAIIGGVLSGIGSALQAAEPEKNKAAGGILQGIGEGLLHAGN